MSTSVSASASPGDRRLAWVTGLLDPIVAYQKQTGENPPADSQLWSAVLERVATEGPALGRSTRWQDAVAWHATQLAGGMAADWVALQGSVWLLHAA